MKNKNENYKKNNKSIKKFINIIEYVIIFLVIFFNGLLLFRSAHTPNKTPSLLGKKVLVIVSGSMIPTINIGDIVILNDTNDVKLGDIIGYKNDSVVVVHRIIKEMVVNGNTMYQTKGDNNETADIDLVDVSSIEGVMVGKIPFIGKILMWLNNNLAIVVVVIAVLLILKYLYVEI